MWTAEALWSIRDSPWARADDVEDGVLCDAVAAARRLMLDALATGRQGGQVYRRAGAPVPALRRDRRSRGQANRTAPPTGVRVPGRRRTPREYAGDGGTSPAPDLNLRGFCLGAFVFLAARSRRVMISRSRSRSTCSAGAGAVRVPARGDVRRVGRERAAKRDDARIGLTSCCASRLP